MIHLISGLLLNLDSGYEQISSKQISSKGILFYYLHIEKFCVVAKAHIYRPQELATLVWSLAESGLSVSAAETLLQAVTKRVMVPAVLEVSLTNHESKFIN